MVSDLDLKFGVALPIGQHDAEFINQSGGRVFACRLKERLVPL